MSFGKMRLHSDIITTPSRESKVGLLYIRRLKLMSTAMLIATSYFMLITLYLQVRCSSFSGRSKVCVYTYIMKLRR